MNIIDSHLHIWQLSRGDYRWLTPELPVLYQDFSLADALSVLNENDVHRSILVQAADSMAETEYLLEMAASQKEHIAGVVGWIDFSSSRAVAHLQRLSENPLLIGVRPMLQDISPVDWILQPQFENVFDKLAVSGLVFDALISAEQLPVIDELAQRHPRLKIVIDHCAKPQLDWQPGEQASQQWYVNLKQVAECANVVIKISGLPSESLSAFTTQPAMDYIQHVFKHFGVERMLWGSDWPVVNQRSHYPQWLAFCMWAAEQLGWDLQQQQLFFADNVSRIYGLSPLDKEDSACQ
ncbi:amidohydrolase family protein [Alteromonadaceae bacterium BrNp21-10]|nr:amidohydrolase family protein [Alteromonadaceae bacterium BrNp21-10]